MERSPKRRRVSADRSVSISPVKIATTTGPIATRMSPPRTARPSYRSPTKASESRRKSGPPASKRLSFGTDGADDDVFDTENIRRIKRSSPRKTLNPTPLRDTVPNRASPTRTPKDAQESASQEGRRRTSRSTGKRVSFATEDEIRQDAPDDDQENQPDRSALTRNGAPEDETTGSNGAYTEEVDYGLPNAGDDNGEDEEPGLPKLPTPDIAFSPAGILSSSPSGRAAQRLKSRTSSRPPPSRRRSVTTTDSDDDAPSAQEPTEKGQRQVSDAHQPQEQSSGSAELEESGLEAEQEPSIPSQPSGPIVLLDTAANAKRDELEELLRQRRRLNDDIDFLDKVHLQSSGRQINQGNIGRLVDLLLEERKSPNSTENEPPTALPSRLKAFLPFTAARQVSYTKPVAEGGDTIQYSSEIDRELVGAFMPLKVATDLEIASSDTHDASILRYVLKIDSSDRLLQLSFTVDMNPEDNRILKLSSGAEWSAWLQPELGRYVKQYLETSDHATHGIASIGTATSRYWQMSCLRAKTWAACVQDHSDLVKDIPAVAEPGKGDRKAVQSYERNIKQLHLGRQSLRLERDGVGLLVTWMIDFDWTGEVSSVVSACAGVPASWRNREDVKALDRIGELFDLFLRRSGVRQALRDLVELVFGKLD